MDRTEPLYSEYPCLCCLWKHISTPDGSNLGRPSVLFCLHWRYPSLKQRFVFSCSAPPGRSSPLPRAWSFYWSILSVSLLWRRLSSWGTPPHFLWMFSLGGTLLRLQTNPAPRGFSGRLTFIGSFSALQLRCLLLSSMLYTHELHL